MWVKDYDGNLVNLAFAKRIATSSSYGMHYLDLYLSGEDPDRSILLAESKNEADIERLKARIEDRLAVMFGVLDPMRELEAIQGKDPAAELSLEAGEEASDGV